MLDRVPVGEERVGMPKFQVEDGRPCLAVGGRPVGGRWLLAAAHQFRSELELVWTPLPICRCHAGVRLRSVNSCTVEDAPDPSGHWFLNVWSPARPHQRSQCATLSDLRLPPDMRGVGDRRQERTGQPWPAGAAPRHVPQHPSSFLA
jgi:hypothetical protein